MARSSPARRSHVVCDHASRRTQSGHRPEMRATGLLPTTLRRRAPTFSFGDPPELSPPSLLLRGPVAGSGGCMARFTTPHALRMCRSLSLRLFEAGVLFPRRRPNHDPLTLPSRRAAYPPLHHGLAPVRTCFRTPGFRLLEETPAHRSEEVSASAQPRPPDHDDP